MHYRKFVTISSALVASLWLLLGSASSAELDNWLTDKRINDLDAGMRAIIAITKDGFDIVDVTMYENIVRANDGSIFQSFQEALYVLKNKSNGTNVICHIWGSTPGGFDNSVDRSLVCFK